MAAHGAQVFAHVALLSSVHKLLPHSSPQYVGSLPVSLLSCSSLLYSPLRLINEPPSRQSLDSLARLHSLQSMQV